MPIINTVANASGRAYGFTRGGDSRILLSATPGPSATITTYSGYIVFKFNATGTLNVGAGTPGTADVFVVGGGSSGGRPNPSFTTYGADGGNGGLRSSSPGFSIPSNTPIPIVVGSTSTASSFGPVTSSGGSTGGTGGIGGGNSPSPTIATGGNGGNGPTNDYETGSPQTYGGGGGGGGGQTPVFSTPAGGGGSGGSSGGGAGGYGGKTAPTPSGLDGPGGGPGSPGVANTGGGGGGGGSAGKPVGTFPVGGDGSGGSGVVIARFPDTQFRTS